MCFGLGGTLERLEEEAPRVFHRDWGEIVMEDFDEDPLDLLEDDGDGVIEILMKINKAGIEHLEVAVAVLYF